MFSPAMIDCLTTTLYANASKQRRNQPKPLRLLTTTKNGKHVIGLSPVPSWDWNNPSAVRQIGAGEEIRTPDQRLGKPMRYHCATPAHGRRSEFILGRARTASQANGGAPSPQSSPVKGEGSQDVSCRVDRLRTLSVLPPAHISVCRFLFGTTRSTATAKSHCRPDGVHG